MRLWHKDLIDVLPRQQLLSQWRECCCIAKNIADNGTPNHILVNKILEYSHCDFINYCCKIIKEMNNRKYLISNSSVDKLFSNLEKSCIYFNQIVPNEEIFNHWMNDRYLKQCYYNLQEKYDCGGITQVEWQKIENKFNELSKEI